MLRELRQELHRREDLKIPLRPGRQARIAGIGKRPAGVLLRPVNHLPGLRHPDQPREAQRAAGDVLRQPLDEQSLVQDTVSPFCQCHSPARQCSWSAASGRPRHPVTRHWWRSSVRRLVIPASFSRQASVALVPAKSSSSRRSRQASSPIPTSSMLVSASLRFVSRLSLATAVIALSVTRVREMFK